MSSPQCNMLGRASVLAFDRRSLLVALLVGAAYYVGAKIGLALTFPPQSVAILWPSNAILLSALLLVPTRRWWMLLVAVLPFHLMAGLNETMPTTIVLCRYVSNVSEALIGAVCVRYLVQGRFTFDTLRNAAVFFAAVVFFAPFVSSFLDAAFVTSLSWGEGNYWQAWSTRFFSNALAMLTLVPVIVTCVHGAAAASRATDGRRVLVLEAMILLLGLALTGALVFNSQPILASAEPALLYLPLPFLLWAALRLGPLGASLSFMVLAFLAIWGAGHGRGPFATNVATADVLSMQMFLTFIAVTLLSFAAVLQERRNTKRQLRSSLERYRAVVESQTDLVCRYLPDTTLTFVNDAYCRFFGRSPEQLIGKRLVELVSESGQETVLRRIENLTRKKQPVTYEHEVQLADGHVRWQQWVDHVILDAEGNVVEFQAVGRDITDRKQAEEANERLVHASRLAVLGELTASIAHEINQPLGAILSNADAAEMLLMSAPVDIDELRQVLEDIRRDDMRAGEVVRQMRTLSRRRELVMEPFDLNRAIGDVLNLVSTDLSNRRVAVVTEFAQLPIVHGDPVHLQQVVLNLILNGVDAMVGLAPPARRLEIRTSRSEGGSIEVAVSDSGSGVPPERMEQLFESFFTTKRDGMGLGLAIARSIVETHEGRIWAENRPQGGATFKFSIPAAASRPSTDPQAGTSHTAP